ncbi:MAG: c-type cytochrome [Bacteroidia bacterium]
MNKKIKVISLIAAVGCISIIITSCGKKDMNSPGVEFMPDMYRSPSLESNMAYVSMVNGDTLEANRMPVAGTIARGYLPYTFANTPDGYDQAKLKSHNPFSKTEKNIKEGEVLYSKFCIHCHGAAGQGDGAVGLKLPGPPPSYTSASYINMTEGEIFQIITYGKGLMGNHASILSQEERWKLVLYVQKLQHPDNATASVADSTAVTKK